MQREEPPPREEFGYDRAPTLERAGRRPERDSYTVDVRASDLQLPRIPALHPCLSYRAWLYSALIGVRGRTATTHLQKCARELPEGFHSYL